MGKRKNKEEMTPREKVSLLYGDGAWLLRGIPRLGIKGLELHDGPLGVRKPCGRNEELNLTLSEPATCFPAPCLAACSFDPALLEEMGKALATECREQNAQILLAPGVNIKRNPLCGRNFEYFSEDPLLAGKMASGYVRGLQSQGIGACLKHFACNSQEYYRMVNNSIVDERALREIYLKPFEIVVKEAKPWSLMTSYNLINGVYASDNEHLIKEILRGEWGYDGATMSDWGGCNDYVLSHNKGLDIEMPGPIDRQKELAYLMKKGALDSKEVDASVKRILALYEKANAPYNAPTRRVDCHALAVKVAQESAVLLKNEDGILPLKNFNNVCVIGELADKVRYQGGGSSHVNPKKLVSFLDAVKELNGNGVGPRYAPGYSESDELQPASLIVDAVDLAASSKTVLFFLGLPPSYEVEGLDRKNMLLPDRQIQCLNAVLEANENVVVVLSCGAPVELPFKDKVKAILLTYLGGEGIGEATRNLLLGTVSPSGHLAETWPVHLAHVPSFGFYPGEPRESLYRESIYVGYRYYSTVGMPVSYPFGHGLSYARFTYSECSVSKPSIKGREVATISLTVKNCSAFPASTVIQVYACPPEERNVFKAAKSLIAFVKVDLDASSSKKVSLNVDRSCFAHFETERNAFLVEGGRYTLAIGTSSEEILFKVPLDVESPEKFVSKRVLIPTYYAPTKDGFLQFDNDFETLYGKKIATVRDSKSRPYNLNSTCGDIRNTWIGKILEKQSLKVLEPTEEMIASFRGLPIRNIIMGMPKQKMAYAVLDFANGRPVQAIWKLVFGYRRKR